MKMQFKVLLRFMVLIIVSLTIMLCGMQAMDHRTLCNQWLPTILVIGFRRSFYRTTCVYVEDGNEMNNTISENVGICNRDDGCGGRTDEYPGETFLAV